VTTQLEQRAERVLAPYLAAAMRRNIQGVHMRYIPPGNGLVGSWRLYRGDDLLIALTSLDDARQAYLQLIEG